MASVIGTASNRACYLFIDGGYLRKVIEKISKDFFNGLELPIDYRKLAQSYTKVFYYDCLPPRNNKESDEKYEQRCTQQKEHFRSLRLLDGWHVIEGVVVGSGEKARQKRVDIQIAVDMLSHSYRRNMHRIVFLAGDQDFKPLVDAIVREGMFIEIWYEVRSASKDLLYAADARRKLDVYTVHGFLTSQFQKQHPLPDRVSHSGKRLKNAFLLKSGTGEQGSVELYSDGDEYIILHADQVNDDYFVHVVFNDLIFVEKVYESVFGKVSWSKVYAS